MKIRGSHLVKVIHIKVFMIMVREVEISIPENVIYSLWFGLLTVAVIMVSHRMNVSLGDNVDIKNYVVRKIKGIRFNLINPNFVGETI